MPITDEQRQALKREPDELWELSKKLEQKAQEYRDCFPMECHKISEEARQILNQRKEDYISRGRKLPGYLGRNADLRERWDKERRSLTLDHSFKERQRELERLKDEWEEIYLAGDDKMDCIYTIAAECTKEINEELKLRCPGHDYEFKLLEFRDSILYHELAREDPLKFKFLKRKYDILFHILDSTKEHFLGGNFIYLQLDPNSDQGYYFFLPVVTAYQNGGSRTSHKKFNISRDLIKALNLPGYVDEPTKNSLEKVEGAQNLLETSMSNSEQPKTNTPENVEGAQNLLETSMSNSEQPKTNALENVESAQNLSKTLISKCIIS